jgi:pyruvate dehydrogenase E1 component alpha subunit
LPPKTKKSGESDKLGGLFRQFNPIEGKMFQVVDQKGEVVNPAWMPTCSKNLLKEAFEWMLRIRTLDLRILSYQRQGRMLTFASNQGQEAAQMGSSFAIDPSKDWVAPAFREMGVWLRQGQSVKQFLQYWNGLEVGFKLSPGVKLLPCCVPISSQNQHAVGLAMAAKYRGEDSVAVAYFGDGGTSEGDFHESINFAAVFKAPVIFFCNNNQYAISVPLKAQTTSRTLAQKAIAYDIPGIKVDGCDFFAVYRCMQEAVAHARSGKGPVLIEAYMYRLGPHTTSDDPTKYRTQEEEKAWAKKDPLGRMRIFLKRENIWSEAWEQSLMKKVNEETDQAMASVEADLVTPLEDLFQFHFRELPAHLRREMEAYKAWKQAHPGE